MEILREKHPVMRIPDLIDFKCSSFEEYKKNPHIVLLDISEEDVRWVANWLTEESSPSGMVVLAFQSWLP